MCLSFALLVAFLVTSGAVIVFPIGSVRRDVHNLQPRAGSPTSSRESPDREFPPRDILSFGVFLDHNWGPTYSYHPVDAQSIVKGGAIFKFKRAMKISDFLGVEKPYIPSNSNKFRGIIVGNRQKDGRKLYGIILCYFEGHGIQFRERDELGDLIFIAANEKACTPYTRMAYPVYETVIRVPTPEDVFSTAELTRSKAYASRCSFSEHNTARRPSFTSEVKWYNCLVVSLTRLWRRRVTLLLQIILSSPEVYGSVAMMASLPILILYYEITQRIYGTIPPQKHSSSDPKDDVISCPWYHLNPTIEEKICTPIVLDLTPKHVLRAYIRYQLIINAYPSFARLRAQIAVGVEYIDRVMSTRSGETMVVKSTEELVFSR